jgi:hypothetical protein
VLTADRRQIERERERDRERDGVAIMYLQYNNFKLWMNGTD